MPRSLDGGFSRCLCTQKAEPKVVVAIVWRVVVAIRRATVLRIVVPTAAAMNTVGARHGRHAMITNLVILCAGAIRNLRLKHERER